jgi:hypothetical protein
MQVIGGYLNYPLEKGRDYTYPFMTTWCVANTPVVGWWRGEQGRGGVLFRPAHTHTIGQYA